MPIKDARSIPHEVSLIGAPSEVGANIPGTRFAPDALRAVGLAERLGESPMRVRDLGNLSGPLPTWAPPVNGYRHLAEVVQWNRTLHAEVYAELQARRLPVVLGGDHSLGIGSISAVARHCRRTKRPLRVLWLDAHSDCNSAESSPTGNLHGMPVACLFGVGPVELTSMGGDVPAILPHQICQVGVRAIDVGETRFAQQVNLHIIHARQLHEIGAMAAVEAAIKETSENTHLHVSLDMDFLDPAIAPGVSTPVHGGASAQQARECMRRIAACGCVGSVDVVELNPLLDVFNVTAELAAELVKLLLFQAHYET